MRVVWLDAGEDTRRRQASDLFGAYYRRLVTRRLGGNQRFMVADSSADKDSFCRGCGPTAQVGCHSAIPSRACIGFSYRDNLHITHVSMDHKGFLRLNFWSRKFHMKRDWIRNLLYRHEESTYVLVTSENIFIDNIEYFTLMCKFWRCGRYKLK